MNKTVLGIAAALVLVLTLSLAFWLVQSEGEGASAGPGTAASPAVAAERTTGELAHPAGDELALHEAESSPAGELALPAGRSRDARRDAEDPLSVAGALVVPAGMPADETLAVEVYLADPKELLLADPVPEDKLHGREPVAADGRFELHLPEGTAEIWAIARGRYLIAASEHVRLPLEQPLELAPELGGWITGRTIPPAEAELAEDETWNAELRPDPVSQIGAANPLWGGGGDVLQERSAVVDLEGYTFELRGVHAGQGYTLSVTPESLAAAKTGAFDVAAGEHVALELPLGLGGTIRGRVVDLGGAGIAGAEIEALQDPIMFGQGGFEVREGESGPDGAFELLHVRPGVLSLRFEAEGYLDKNQSIELAEGQVAAGLEVVLDSGARVAGRVTWPDGAPAAEIEVEVDFDPSFLGGMEAFNAMRGADGEDETDADGRFAIDGLGKGPFLVQAEAQRETGGKEVAWRARASAVKPGTLDVALVLEQPIGVAGRVVDDLGAPVTKFSVHARTKTSGMLAGLGAETATGTFEDPDGRFLLEGLRPGEWEAFPQQEGYGQAEMVPFHMPLEEGALLALVLERGASVEGTVVAPSGAPIAGATVGQKRGFADISRLGTETGQPATATSDEQGRFRLAGLAAEPLELVAHHPEYASSAALAVELAPAEARTELVLTLRTGGRILGVIYDDEGAPWPGQTILTQDPTLEQGQRWATSDGQGEFEFANLAPGSYQVMTMPRGGGVPGGDDEVEGSDFADMFADMKFTMAEVVEGEDAFVELGAKPANPVLVRGRVVAGSEGVDGAVVSFVADGAEGFESIKFTSTESEGSFELELTKPGRYLVTVQQMLGTGQQQSFELLREIPEAEEHELTLEMPLGGISGVVRGPDGRPVSARISLGADGPVANGSFTGGNYAEIWTDDDGRYELRWLKAGAYSVSAGGSFLGGMFGDTGEQTYGRQVRRGIEVDEGEWVRGVDFRLEKPGRIAGRVSDTAGYPVVDAAIFLRDGDGNPIDRISMVTTDSSGRFEYAGLEPGPYRIQARTDALVSSSAVSVQVREGEATDAALVLDGGTVLVVSLSDKEGNYVRCRVSVTDGDGNQVNGLWSLNDLMNALSGSGFSTDEQRVGPLPAGKYTISAIADDGRDAEKTVTLSGQEERPIRLRLD